MEKDSGIRSVVSECSVRDSFFILFDANTEDEKDS